MRVEPTVLGQMTGSIRILLIDDDVAWVELLQDKLEAADDEIFTTTATSAAEAESVLQSEEELVDCIVCDYRMPDTDGLEFLSTVQSTFDDIPFIFLTGAGSEYIASKAVSKGVSDYITKDQLHSDDVTLLNRIERAVETTRVEAEAIQKRDLYETLLKQTNEGICVTQGDEVVFVNDRLTSFLGPDESTLVGSSFSDVIEHTDAEDDVTALRSSQGQVVKTSVSTTQMADRVYELRERTFQINDEPFSVWSFRDITAANRRKRQLHRERELSESTIEILAQSSTDQTVEQSFSLEMVDERRFQFAWVGESNQGTQLDIQAYAGNGQEYLSAISPITCDDSGAPAPPSLQALRDGEARFLYDISEQLETPWGQAADAQGFVSAAALPLVDNGIPYGVFCLYSSEQSVFDSYDEQFLQKLADALARVVVDKKRAAALASEQVVEITFRVTSDQFYLNEALQGDPPGEYGTATVESVVQQSGDGVVEFITVEDTQPDSIVTAVSEHNAAEAVSSHSEQSDARIQVETNRTTLGGLIQETGVRLREIMIEDGVAEVTIQLPVERDEQPVLDRIREDFDIDAVTGHITKSVQPRSGAVQPSDVTDLTQKQQQAVEAALEAGYFARPRENSASEVAELLGVSHSTFLQHLRAAERKLFADLFGER